MKRTKQILLVLTSLIVGILFSIEGNSQDIENEYQTRTEAKISFEPLKKLEISITPELRWDETFSLDKYLLETKFAYKPLKGLSVGGSYRFIANEKKTKPTEYLHRYAFDAKYQRSFKQWKPSIRLKYTNYTEEDSKGEFLRYKASVLYDIKNCKISPFASFEPFQELGENGLYKIRYSLGAKYKINKHSSIKLGYKLDYYLQDYLNKHIIYVGYKFNF